MIRLTRPSLEADDFAAVQETLSTGMLVQGARVAAFEQALADVVDVPHAVAVTNCTAALHLSLQVLGTRPGDLVVVTAYSWTATANVIELCGAQPVFVDVDPDTFNIDPAALEHTLGELKRVADVGRRVRALLPVHTFGQMADMARISEIAARFEVPIVEDAACALGAERSGRRAGASGVVGCFSFHPRKAITTGEGGAVVTRDAAHTRTLRALRNHGLDPDSPTPDFVMPGHNTRMTEFQAALGVTQLKKLPRIVEARRAGAARYDALLQGTAIRAPVVAADSRHVYQSYVALLPADVAPRRAEVIAALRARGVETTIGTVHMPLTTYYRTRYGYERGQFPVTDDIAARSLTLPLFEGVTEAEQRTVVTALSDVVVALG